MQKNNLNHPLFIENTSLFDEFCSFKEKIIALSKVIKMNLSNFDIDHIALRVNENKKAEEWLTLLLNYGIIVSSNIINGRVIYLIQLRQPLFFLGQYIDIIELPFPKNKYYPKEGWEHIEIVVPFQCKETSMDWINRIKNQFLLEKIDGIKIKEDEPKVDGELYLNPSIAISFINKQYNHTCIKIHPYCIKQIIKG